MSHPANSSDSTLNMQLSLETLMKFISNFDGNLKNLSPFLSDCDTANEMCPEHLKKPLLRYIIHQFTGHARISISNYSFDHYRELKNHLISTYGGNKHTSQLELELRNCKQKRDESDLNMCNVLKFVPTI